MDTSTLTIVGIIVTPVTAAIAFALTYWKTVGAKKEREKRARHEIVSILVDFMSKDQRDPDLTLVQALLRSKSRYYDIGEMTMADFPAIMDDAVSRIAEDQLADADHKRILIERGLAVKRNLELQKRLVREGDTIVRESSRGQYTWQLLATSAVASLFVAWVTGAYGYYASVNTTSWRIPTIVTAGVALAIIAFLSSAVMFLSRLETSRKKAVTVKYVEKAFEEMVENTLRAHLGPSRVGSMSSGMDGCVAEFDLVIDLGGIRIPVETKYDAPNAEVVSQMYQAMNGAGFTKGL
jgi:hypothetical protein